MGLDMAIEWNTDHRYITVEDGNGDDKGVELNGLLVRQRAVVCRGTTCFWPNFLGVQISGNHRKARPSPTGTRTRG